MRFLMLNWRDPRNPGAGGAERVTLGFMSALARRGHDVYWWTFEFPGASLEETVDGVHVVRRGGFLTSILEVVAWYRSQPPFDLVIDQHHGIPWYAPWWCGTRCVAYIHEVLGPIWDAFYVWPLNRFGQRQEQWTHRLYRKVPFWTVSDSTRRMLERNGVAEVTVLPNGVDTRAVEILEPKPLARPLRLAAVSRLAPNKRVDHLIRMTRYLIDRGLPTELTVVGTGVVEDPLRHLAAELDLAEQVAFTGAASESEKDAILRGAHFLVHASQREGWGLNVIEANAMGTPAAVYPVGGLVDSTLDNETGLVATLESPEALGDRLIQIMQSPSAYETLRHRAWERAKTFHWDHVLPQACDWLEAQARLSQSADGR